MSMAEFITEVKSTSISISLGLRFKNLITEYLKYRIIHGSFLSSVHVVCKESVRFYHEAKISSTRLVVLN